jgi:two-component system, chemotaxis family, protein-glutamate methylesterase/glutaminase
VGAQPRGVVVVGASAGGVEALCAMVAGIPAGLPVCVLVVLHLPAGGKSSLPAILDRAGPLSAAVAVDGGPLTAGHVHVAPPDQHLAVTDRTTTLLGGAPEHGHRPSINVLFRAAARAWRSAVTAVLLSGALDDGVDGLLAVARKGGRVVVQDPADAIQPYLPAHALRRLTPDHVLPAAGIGPLLATTPAARWHTPGRSRFDERAEA